MRAGSLRRPIIIEQSAPTPDGAGGFTRTWSTESSTWAAVEELSGTELASAQQYDPRITIRVRVRHPSPSTGAKTITPAMRVHAGTRLFDIHAVLDQGDRHRELWLLCEEREAA
jgi:SPP1 family predicted phage head-tail adaptor